MKLTLLDMVQSILSSLSSDEVNSVSDTAESRQVAEVIRTVYFNIINRAQLPEHKDLISLVPSGDLTKPILMYRPDNVGKIEWIKYDINDDVTPSGPNYQYVTILPVQQFMDWVNQSNPEDADVGSLLIEDFKIYYKNDIHPTYCTIIKDYLIVFDSYDSSVEATLQESKVLAYGQIIPSWTVSDGFVPELEDNMFPLLLNEAKSLAFLELKQVQHDHAERESRRQWRTIQHSKYLKKPDFNELPNFGRRH